MDYGKYIVDKHGITYERPIYEQGLHGIPRISCYERKFIMPKETFIEAYNKYIKGEDKGDEDEHI